MPSRIIIATNERMKDTRLVFIKEIDRVNPKERRALFLCDCGQTTEANIAWVRHLNTTSCGCYRQEVTTEKNTKHSQAIRGNQSGAYRSWQAMHQRIRSDPYYQHLTICESWFTFSNFFTDMGQRPKGFTIERKDNLKGYEPNNCIWADWKTQANNSSNVTHITLEGETHSLSEWCRIKGISYSLLKQRRRRGMTTEDALVTPIDTTKQGGKR